MFDVYDGPECPTPLFVGERDGVLWGERLTLVHLREFLVECTVSLLVELLHRHLVPVLGHDHVSHLCPLALRE